MIFVTGANGFVGKHLCDYLDTKNIKYIPGTRENYKNIETFNDWENTLSGVDSIIHLVSRVHVMVETAANPLDAFRAINVVGTMNMANAAKKLGVKKFIFMSSIKVNGEGTDNDPYRAADTPKPEDNYGVTKLEAEVELMKLHEPGVFDVVIIRPPLIYGKGVKANMANLFSLVKKGLPLPFGLVNNKRSLVSVLNLCDLVVTCLKHPKAPGKIFLVSDNKDLSLKDLIKEIGIVIGKRTLLIPIPLFIMRLGLTLLGKASYSNRLFGNLHVDISSTMDELAWTPPFSFKDSFK